MSSEEVVSADHRCVASGESCQPKVFPGGLFIAKIDNFTIRVCDRTVRSVLSRNPFGIRESKWPRTNRENNMGMLDAVRHIRRIDIECHARRCRQVN